MIDNQYFKIVTGLLCIAYSKIMKKMLLFKFSFLNF